MGNALGYCDVCGNQICSFEGWNCTTCANLTELGKNLLLETRARHSQRLTELARQIDGLKGVATSAHVALKEALPYVNNDAIEQKIKDVLERLDIWGAHP